MTTEGLIQKHFQKVIDKHVPPFDGDTDTRIVTWISPEELAQLQAEIIADIELAYLRKTEDVNGIWEQADVRGLVKSLIGQEEDRGE